MASLNKVFLIGNLTRDPELRYTNNGVPVANLGVAVNRKFRDKSGELKEDVCFVTVTVWDKQAEACAQYLQKGKAIFVEGMLQSRTWETNDGQKRSAIDVRAERVQFLSPINGTKSAEAQPENTGQTANDSFAVHSTQSDVVKAEDIAWDE